MKRKQEQSQPKMGQLIYHRLTSLSRGDRWLLAPAIFARSSILVGDMVPAYRTIQQRTAKGLGDSL